MKNKAPVLKNQDIILRLPKLSDIDDRFELGKSREFILMCGGEINDIKPFTREDLESWYLKTCNHECSWIIEKAGKCIGIARLTIDSITRKARYSIGIFDDMLYGKGIGTEVTKLVLDYTFNTLKLNFVDLKVLEYNKRAIACYKKCGFKTSEIIHNSDYINGKWESDVVMSISSDEYFNQAF